MPNITVYSPSEKLPLVANVPRIVAGQENPVTVQIPTGTTASVATTCCTPAEVDAGTADWVDWPAGTKTGPYIDSLIGKVTAIKLSSAAGGNVYLVR